MHDFFISYSNSDRAWAEWIAWQLEDAGYSIVVQAWDFRPGTNFVLEMHSAAKSATRTIAVLSPEFLSSPFAQSEWAAAFATDPSSTLEKLIPIRVKECALTGLLSPIVYIDLVGVPEDAAKEKLLTGISRARGKPHTIPPFPLSRTTSQIQPSRRPTASSKIKLLHLSGLQFRATETDPIKSAALSALPFALASATATSGVCAVLLSGDLTATGSAADFRIAHRGVAELCAQLSLDATERCFITPGNHDVYWPDIGPADSSVVEELTDQERIARVLAHPPTMFMLSTRLRNYYDFTEAVSGRARAWRKDRPWQVEKLSLDGRRLAVIQLNSAWAVGPGTQDPILGEFQIREALSDAGDTDLRIWLMHHPLDSLGVDERARILPLILGEGSSDLLLTNADHSAHSSTVRSGGLANLQVSSVAGPNPTCNLITLPGRGQNLDVETLQFDRRQMQWVTATFVDLNSSPRPTRQIISKHTAGPATNRKQVAPAHRKGSSGSPRQLTTQSFSSQPNILSVSRGEVDLLLTQRRPVLLMTAVETELSTVLSVLRPLNHRRSVLRTHIGQETYYVGTFGVEPAVVTMCGMGALGRDSILLAAQQAISELRPIAVVMIGIAFGKSPATQRIGDVLVASQVVSYEQQKVRSDGLIHRGSISLSGPILLNRFRQALNWNFSSSNGERVRALVGPVLSGEKLIDSLAYRDQLFEAFPQAIGGEMEGAGLAAVAARAQVEWILVKGICDWADGQKVDNHQAFAAQCATALVHHVLSDSSALEAARGLTPRST